MRHRHHLTVIAVTTALLLSACGGNDDTGGEGTFPFGEPAAASDADRTIEVTARDELRFDPDVIEVSAGETVTFVVTNAGETRHEFTLGDEAAQNRHQGEMEAMAGHTMTSDEPNVVSLEPGETGELSWTFTTSGEVLYGCHEPGHYAAGMVGTVRVSEG